MARPMPSPGLMGTRSESTSTLLPEYSTPTLMLRWKMGMRMSACESVLQKRMTGSYTWLVFRARSTGLQGHGHASTRSCEIHGTGGWCSGPGPRACGRASRGMQAPSWHVGAMLTYTYTWLRRLRPPSEGEATLAQPSSGSACSAHLTHLSIVEMTNSQLGSSGPKRRCRSSST